MPALEKVVGVVKRLTFVNPENGWFVAAVNVQGKGERTVVGSAANITVGEHLEADGTWGSTSWGPQFKATEVRLTQPRALDEIASYLAGSVEGVGPGFAKKLVDAFGEAVFDVIEKTPEKLGAVPGIGKKRAEALVAGYKENRAMRKIMLFLHRSGLGPGRAKRVYDKLGDNAVELIQKNPYILCKDVWGIGFKIADEAAQKQGVKLDSEFRIRAGITHLLRTAEQQGSCGVPVEKVLSQASEFLGVDYDLIETSIGYEIEAGDVYKDVDGEGTECLFPKRVYLAEKGIAEQFLAAVNRPVAYPVKDLEASILDAEIETGIILEDSQREAIRLALCNNVCIITGGPGCGKSTITKVLLHVFAEQNFGIVLAAPTGKAARRAAEATGHEAGTIHRTFDYGKGGGGAGTAKPKKGAKRPAQSEEAEFDSKFGVNKDNPLDADVLVLDETSMLDAFLTMSVLKGLHPRTRIIFIGDVDQLPSVGPGKVLADIIASRAVPCSRLTTVFRQAANSAIIRNAHRINRGEMPDLGYHEGSDFAFFNFSPNDPKNEDEKLKVRTTMRNELVRMARDMYKRGFDPLKDVQVYAPMKKGPLGIVELNLALQKALNPRPSCTLEVFGTKWGIGDKVMQLKNNRTKDVFNGNVGFIKEIDTTTRSLAVDFDGQVVMYKSTELDELTLAFAITIHKSQGSESPVVLIPIDWSHFTMLKRNLLYTGVTRAKKLCILLGDKKAVQHAVRNNQNDERHTRLKALLQAGLPREIQTALREEAIAG